MKVSVDTNVLARAVLQDDAEQSRAARKLLKEASLIAVSLPCLCELVWILRHGAKISKEDIAAAIRALLNTGSVAMNRPAVEIGLKLFEDGGDFADGIMAHEGQWLGGETFLVLRREGRNPIIKAGDGRHSVGLTGKPAEQASGPMNNHV
jgi:predicted nucleic-acid-binding protein